MDKASRTQELRLEIIRENNMETKICSKCSIEKSISEFYKKGIHLQAQCKRCCSEYRKQYKEKHKEYFKQRREKRKEYSKQWYIKNKEHRKEYFKQWRIKNKEHRKEYDKQWKKNNKEHIREWRRKYYKKNKENIQVKLAKVLRDRLRAAIKNNAKSGSAVKDLGCSINYLKKYLESKFQEGMTWKNHGKGEGRWNIDHIIPISYFDLTDRKQFLKACHYTNLQPLWEKDNLSKNNRYIG